MGLTIFGFFEVVCYIGMNRELGINFFWIVNIFKLSDSVVGVIFFYLLIGFRVLKDYRKRKLLFMVYFCYVYCFIGI